ncbi:MAG: sugar ABC transporter permease [Fibrobacter sp.]|nr:sugar ABC transporter permease [Fibrobacter sp.]
MSTDKKESIVEWIKKAWPLFPAALYLFGFLIVVFVYLLYLSLGDGSESNRFPSLKPFIELFNDAEFIKALLNTTIFTLVGTPLELVTGLLFALLVYRSFFMRGLIRSIFLIPLAIPALVTAMLIFILFDFPGGHINHLLLGKYPIFPQVIDYPIGWRSSNLFAMGISMLGKVWRDMPISMLILLAGLNNIDPELFDAAKTMGASLKRRIFSIIIPMILPSISAVLLLRSVEMWKEFIFPFVLAGRNRLLGTLIDYYYNSLGDSHMAAAVAIVMVVCIVISTLLILKSMELMQKLLYRR